MKSEIWTTIERKQKRLKRLVGLIEHYGSMDYNRRMMLAFKCASISASIVTLATYPKKTSIVDGLNSGGVPIGNSDARYENEIVISSKQTNFQFRFC